MTLLLSLTAPRLQDADPVDLRQIAGGPLFRHGRDAILVVDRPTGRVLLRNPAAERIFGSQAADPAPPTLARLLPDLPASLPLADPAPLRARALCRTGEELAVEVVVCTPEHEPDRYAILLVHPVDDRLRTAALERRLGELLTLVNHDLRTPLTSIVGFAELLLERNFAPDRQRQLLTFIQREGARLEALLDRVPRAGR